MQKVRTVRGNGIKRQKGRESMINTNQGFVKPSGLKIRAAKSPPNLALRTLLVSNLKKSNFTEKK